MNLNKEVKVFENLERNSNQFKTECSKIAKKISTDEFTILKVVQDLEPFLINESPHRRLEGMWIVSTIIEQVPFNYLDQTQLEYISVFYADRLKDNSQVIPAVLQGIYVIVQHEKLPDGACTRLLSSLFHNVACQQQQLQERQNIYKTLEIMVARKPQELHAMSYDFIYGVISAMDSERDPTNLIQLFNWLPKFLKEFQFGHLTEEMFEVVSCYFPVDFKVPAHMAKGISRESLANTLAPCLCAIPEFGEFCLPLALEKLSSSLRIAKLDSLQLLYMGCENFTESKYLEYSTQIWTSIQLELFKLNNEDLELEQACLKSLQAFIQKISESNTDTFKAVLGNITDSLKGNIMMEHNYFNPSIKLLLSVSRGSKYSANHISQQILPVLLNLFNITMSLEKRVLILDTLCNFTETHLDMDSGELPEVNCVINLCFQIIKEVELRATAFKYISKFIKKFNAKRLEDLGEILHNFLFIEQESQVVAAIKLCLHEFGRVSPNELLKVISFNSNLNGLTCIELYIEYLVSIVDLPLLRNYVLEFLIQHCQNYSVLTPVALSGLKQIMKTHESDENIQTHVFNSGIISCISNWLLNNNVNEVYSSTILLDVSNIFKNIIGFQTSLRQKEIITTSNQVIMDFKAKPTVTHLFIIDGLLMRLRIDVVEDFNLIENIFNIALTADDEEILDTSAQLLANLVNKIPDDDNLFNSLCMKCSTNSKQENEDQKYVKNISCITTWVTKGLLMRGHHISSKFVDILLDLVRKYPIASSYLKIIMSDEYSSLSEVSYCNKRLFYQQRFFSQFTSVINDEENYLTAFALILEDIPEKILNIYKDKVVTLILSISYKFEEPKVLISVLNKLKHFIKSVDESATFYMEEYMTRLLKLTKFKKSLIVRILAIECLDLYTNGYPVYKLLHFKDTVIEVLKELIDDHKRLVRKAAMEARLNWYLLGAPL